MFSFLLMACISDTQAGLKHAIQVLSNWQKPDWTQAKGWWGIQCSCMRVLYVLMKSVVILMGILIKFNANLNKLYISSCIFVQSCKSQFLLFYT
jgi:hypothetical protein